MAEESARAQTQTPNPNPKPNQESDPKVQVDSSPPPAPVAPPVAPDFGSDQGQAPPGLAQSTGMISSPVLAIQSPGKNILELNLETFKHSSSILSVVIFVLIKQEKIFVVCCYLPVSL